MTEPTQSNLRDPLAKLVVLSSGLRERGIEPQGEHNEVLRALGVIDELRDVLARAARMAEQERAGMTQQILQEGLR
jgi:hypothetical protein